MKTSNPTTWFITGTSSGFGRQLTEQLLARGDRVAATLRKPQALAALTEKYPDSLWVRELDVTDTEQIRTVVAAAFNELGRIDVVVSNAGYAVFGAAEELSDDQIHRQIETNVIGSVQLVRAVTPHLRSQGGGKVLQLSSMGGQIAFPSLSVYHLSKWAIEGFFEGYAPEVAPFGIRTCLVEPGSAATEFGGSSASWAPALDEYTDTPAGHMRSMILSPPEGQEQPIGDPTRFAELMIDAADSDELPPRLLLGADAYQLVSDALRARLDAVEKQKPLTVSASS
ncbi:3-oxoacyl-[acyl-carrier protein] reductase [Rhodococcus sp. B7740]|uniref:SDR family oxidoreductase n=1 Tax=Rhodococcus sp. B7740 TaxID=1564114 RepID=UPI0005D8387F|nr:SDR family oxidoreductase [Rhodococcus sp. B7740]AJW40210.1 3-oxoacyl-[acyl-carrier protein] reductase [Rhodococcus sp. B7740]